eukprot:TRINITY_DN3736_c0_g2_i1.p3 TRINITY_DN3736_c0_g2~~TRINITY_DN3736_c0_g2_i1.p3  ORF type:complete len:194 (-),score=22.71 TRINITY_DN3736_c0_g2_i1:40-621(-)
MTSWSPSLANAEAFARRARPCVWRRRPSHMDAHVLQQMPVRQWLLALPITLRLLLAAQSELLTPVLQVVHVVITHHLLVQAGLKVDKADSGAVTLIQRCGSAANLNIHLHCLVLDGVYRRGTDCEPEFVEVPFKLGLALAQQVQIVGASSGKDAEGLMAGLIIEPRLAAATAFRSHRLLHVSRSAPLRERAGA